ncbi:spore germination lipoprotein GerD [Alkalihalophilus marmarensis]|uniref:spore germination lipoprotein GerD n=1 Tax=Alkalihalophilus marmarensis TaxID=521377 RepID=UPI002DBBE5CE|nr:spore germination lipoprotein GerD [Alkalihalophilus marmarensis]MEC2073907.1 spore germination lipoprotein GerD [Alkalihalophilus marmarensis]
MKKFLHGLIVCSAILTLISCATAEGSGGNNTDYEGTKKMMVDMLKTDEGKQAIQEIMNEEEMRHELVMDNAYVKETIQETLTSEKGRAFWQEVMQDPEFAKTFAESMQTENEKMLKGLMKDPEYQGMMITVLQNPEMEETVLEVMKSKEYRQQVMTVMSEAFESPYFVAKISEILGSVAEEQMKKQDPAKAEEEKKQQEEQQQDEGGDGGGGSGGQSSGG